MRSPKFTSNPKQPVASKPPRSTIWVLALIAALLPVQNLSAARLSVLYSGGGSQKTYVRVFATSTTYDGNLGGLAGADAKCQARADAASLGGTWKAIISTSTVNARDRFTFRKLPVFNLKGNFVWNPISMTGGSGAGSDVATQFSYINQPPFSAGYSGWDALASAIQYTETTTSVTGYVWTGSSPSGVLSSACSDWTSNAGGVNGTVGRVEYKSDGWIYTTNFACSNSFRLYCLEDE